MIKKAAILTITMVLSGVSATILKVDIISFLAGGLVFLLSNAVTDILFFKESAE